MMMKKNLDTKGIPSVADIQVGLLYEVDHSKLPLTSSEHFKSIRVVMVNDMSLHQISVSFPSPDSLKTYMCEENPNGFLNKKLLDLDEKHSLPTEIASDVLYRVVPPEEVQEHPINMWRFWMVRRRSESYSCLNETMKHSGMVQWGMWGKRKYKILSKRERQVTKRRKQSNTHNKLVAGRWTENRYKSALENILQVLKAKRAHADKPILRAPLRSEARKLIGDTGLIDHLLKHIAGEVAPGGAERFRRRHNPNGVLEFWLESAETSLEEAIGVEGQNLTPLNLTQDPNCVRMFNEVWQRIQNLNREDLRGELDLENTSNCVPANIDQGQIAMQEKYTELLDKKSKIDEDMLKLSKSFSAIGERVRSFQEEVNELKLTTEGKAPVDTESDEAPMMVSQDIQAPMMVSQTPPLPQIETEPNELPTDCSTVNPLPRIDFDLNELAADCEDHSTAAVFGDSQYGGLS